MALHPDRIVREAAEVLRVRRNAVALTGAGISVESGIPAFRGAQGLWEKYDPMEYATIVAFRRDPARVWTMLSEMVGVFSRAAPNPAHAGLAEMEKRGILRSVITQNVDGLHQAAGSKKVIEYHGNAEELVCLSCRNRYPSRLKIREGIPPRCACGKILKPNLILFGETIPPDVREEAESEAEQSAVLLVIGTSAQVVPACDIPLIARRKGAVIIEINTEETFLTRTVADLHIQDRAGRAVSLVLEEIGDSPPHG